MTRTKTYKSDIKAAIHETMSGLYEAGMIDEQTMSEFDASCLMVVSDVNAKEVTPSDSASESMVIPKPHHT